MYRWNYMKEGGWRVGHSMNGCVCLWMGVWGNRETEELLMWRYSQRVCHNTVRWNSLEVFSRVLDKSKPERFPKTKVKILIQEPKPVSKNRMWNAEVLWSLRKVRDPKSAATSNCILIVVILMIWANIDRSFWITWRLFFKRTVVWTSAVLKCLKAPFIN